MLCALKQKGKVIDAVYLIDNDETTENSCAIIKDIRETLDRRDVLVSSLEVNESDAVRLIPEFMAQFITHDTQQKRELIVDLTTGPKYIASLLYATANFCGIDNIYYFLLKKSDKSGLCFEDLDKDDFQYVKLPKFSDKSLGELSQRSHLDIIYYLKDIEKLVEAFEPRSLQLANEIDRGMRLAVFDYFDDRYKSAILSVGSLLETWTYRINEIWVQQGVLSEELSRDLKSDPRKNWNNELQKMAKVCKKLRESRINEVNSTPVQELLIGSMSLAMSHEMIDLVRKYRNMAAHVTDQRYQIEKADTKLVLDIGFAFLDKCKQANFLLGFRENYDDFSCS